MSEKDEPVKKGPVGRFRSIWTLGLVLSLLGHTVATGGGLWGFNTTKPFEPATEAVAVDVVSEKDFNEMMRGDKTSKIVAKEPERRIDRVAEIKEDKDPGLEKRDVAVIPTKQEAKPESKPEPVEKLAAIIPPTRPPELRVTPPLPAPPVKVEEEEEDDKDAEIIRQKTLPPKKDEPKKAEPQPDQLQKLLEEEKQREADRLKAAEDKRRLEEKLKADAEAAKRAEEKRKADEKKKAEAEKKAKEEKAKKELAAKEKAEEQKLLAAISSKLQVSRDAPSSTGSTGAVVASRSTAGTSTATGNRLSPSDRSQLANLFAEQMTRCISYPGGLPQTNPQFSFTVSQDGKIISAIQLENRSNDPNFKPYAEAATRAFRSCQPYRIPDRFLATYQDWKNLVITIDATGR